MFGVMFFYCLGSGFTLGGSESISETVLRSEIVGTMLARITLVSVTLSGLFNWALLLEVPKYFLPLG